MRLAILTLMVLTGCDRSTPLPAAQPVPAPSAIAPIGANSQTDAPTDNAPELEPTGVTAEQAALDSACDRLDRLPAARAWPEAEAIARSGRAAMNGNKLVVGRFTFDAAVANDGYGYAYVGRYDGTEVDILSYDNGESGGWTLADQQSGRELGAAQLPIPSPDGTVWAVNSPFEEPDGEVAFYFRDLKGWTKVAGFPLEWACGLKWIDASTLELRDHTGRAARPRSVDGQKGTLRHIVRAGGGWVLR